jgi:hypothetical protein
VGWRGKFRNNIGNFGIEHPDGYIPDFRTNVIRAEALRIPLELFALDAISYSFAEWCEYGLWRRRLAHRQNSGLHILPCPLPTRLQNAAELLGFPRMEQLLALARQIEIASIEPLAELQWRAEFSAPNGDF